MTPPPNTVALIQARVGSTRLPRKVLTDLGGKPALAFILDRVAQATRLDAVWVATSIDPADDPIAELCASVAVPCHRGETDDVLARLHGAARAAQAEHILRLTADCPFVDPGIIDAAIALYRGGRDDYVSNVVERTYPDGLDVEVFSFAVLDETHRDAHDPRLREHVTPFMRTGVFPEFPSGDFRLGHLTNPTDFSHLRWTLDEPEDLGFFHAVLPLLPPNFTWQDVLAALTAHPELFCWNRQKKVRIPALYADRPRPPHDVTLSSAFFDRASRTIPLATQTFSKSHQQSVPGASPLFLSHGKGARAFDIDGNEYIDYVMGLLPVILGHCDPDVDAAIVRQLEHGISFSLATKLEAELAERLVELIPCAQMVRFGKNGSDATTAAIRLARAHTGRDRIAICGYHGWHDWYIGTTTRHRGVPPAVRALAATFPFNDADALEQLLAADPDGFAAVILEPDGLVSPAPGFLARLRALTQRYGTVLIFDEIITGFRQALGGAQAVHGVTPDLACFGKAMANGMPISAIVGQRPIMMLMEEVFCSATFAGEALSLAAATATLDKLDREQVPQRLARLGARLIAKLNQSLTAHGLDNRVHFAGNDWWPRISVSESADAPHLLKSLLRQEMHRHGLLISAGLNLSLAHDSEAIVAATVSRFDTAIAAVREALQTPNPAHSLAGPLVQPTFAVR